MPTYSKKVRIPGKSSQELYDKVSEGIDRLMSQTSIGKYAIERDPIQRELHLKGSLFSATLACLDAEIELRAQLSLMAIPFREQLDQGMDRWLTKIFDLIPRA